MFRIAGKRFPRRGISTIIAALLLIAIAISAGVLLYVFSIGLIGSLQGTGGQQTRDQLIMEAYDWHITSGPIKVNLRNTDGTTINIGAASHYLGGLATTGTRSNFSSGSSSTALIPGGTCVDSITIPSGLGTVTAGVAYVLKIGLADGGMMSYSVVAGLAQ